MNRLNQFIILTVSVLSHLSSINATPTSQCTSNIPKLGAVASEQAQCSKIGTSLLEAGGNAIDALVGTVFCVGVKSIYHSGIGGGGFMIVRSNDGKYEMIDFRETAPAAAFQDMYKNNINASLYGGLASGVPGELRGLEYVHNKYGVLSWKQVMKPAIKLAREGYKVNEDLISYIGQAGNPAFLTEDPSWAIDYAPNGTLLKLGQTLTRRRYADTLERISQEGADAFYTGAIAKSTIAAIQKANGTMTMEDLKNYTVVIREPAFITYRGYKLHACSTPSGGEVVLSTLKIVEGYDNFGDPSAINLTTHRLDEAMRFAYGERSNLGDPSFVAGINDYQTSMLSEATAEEVRAKITDNATHDVSYYDPSGLESLTTHGTSHVVTADAQGFAVSLTTTINTLFGSHLMVPETGVVTNNEMNDFSVPGQSNAFGYIPSPANFIVPGKRPLSSISPTIIESADGKLYFVIGSAGGSRIITATIQNIHHVLDQGFTVPQALAQPRFHDQLSPSVSSFEYAFDNSTTAFMKSLGHNITWVAPGQSTAQGLRILPNGTFEAAGEPRQFNSGGFAV